MTDDIVDRLKLVAEQRAFMESMRPPEPVPTVAPVVAAMVLTGAGAFMACMVFVCVWYVMR